MPAKSKQQQKFMGIVRAIQKGDEPASKFSKDAQDAADDMKKKDVEKFASTKHKGLPKKVEQYLRQQIRKSVEELLKKEDYVETCGYTQSVDGKKLKTPGATGEEDRHLKEKNESMNPSAIKKMRDEFEKTGDLPPHLKKFALDLKILKKKHKVKNIVVPGLEWMSDMKEQSVNEARLDPKQTIQQLGGNRFLYMVGAKNLAIDKPRNELHMKIMRNAKGVSHVVVRLTSLDLYDMKFLSIRAGKIRVKAKEKGVYGDQLATFFKKHTGLNTRL